MKNFILLFVFSAIMVACSSSNDDNDNKGKNNLTVELSDIKGTWYVTKSTSSNWNGVILVLNDNKDCGWVQRDGDYVGPYYFLENVNDNTLKEQCALLDCPEDRANKIHIKSVRISKFATEESNYKDTYKSVLNMTCDLRTYLPSKNSEAFMNNVDHDAWWFWIDGEFSYSFEITEYTPSKMKLKLDASDFLFVDHESKYPLRTVKDTELTLERAIKE